jgi:hypothetical protein
MWNIRMEIAQEPFGTVRNAPEYNAIGNGRVAGIIVIFPRRVLLGIEHTIT